MQSMTLEQLRAITFNQWLADEIQASLDDPRPNTPDSEVMTELDALLAALLDATERNSLYRGFQILALEDLPVIPLVEFPFYSLVGPRVQNHHLGRMWPISNWAEVSVV